MRYYFARLDEKHNLLGYFEKNFDENSIEKLNFFILENLLLNIEPSETTPFFYNSFSVSGGGGSPGYGLSSKSRIWQVLIKIVRAENRITKKMHRLLNQRIQRKEEQKKLKFSISQKYVRIHTGQRKHSSSQQLLRKCSKLSKRNISFQLTQ